MTEDMMDLQAMVGKSPDADFLRDMIGFAAKRLMELEAGGLTGVGYGEKDAERLVQRNGYRKRDWETRAGTVVWIGVQFGTLARFKQVAVIGRQLLKRGGPYRCRSRICAKQL